MIFWVTYSISSNNNNYLASYIFNKSNMIWEAYSGLGLLDSVKLVDGPHLMEKLVALQQSNFVRKLWGQMTKILAARTRAHEIQIHPVRNSRLILLTSLSTRAPARSN